MKGSVIAALAALALSACTTHHTKGPDTLALFQKMTSIKSQFQIRTGDPTQFPGSEKICITATCKDGDKDCSPSGVKLDSPIMVGSDDIKYYDLTKKIDGYVHYGKESTFAKDVAELAADLDSQMASFEATGLRAEIKARGMTPALMFDIDNTLEFSAGPDSDNRGEGPAIQGMVDFAKRWCFKDDLSCYFITARYCNKESVPPTLKWVMDNLDLTEAQARKYVHFSSNPTDLTCSLPGSPNVAYKDVIRQALSEQQNVFWLMSVGDQLTDSLGLHSGMKIRVPNQFFHADITPNQYAPWGKGQCGSPTTIAPPASCSAQLLDKAIKVSSVDYCAKQTGGW